MSGIFYDCSRLISLPDISKWNINNTNDFSGLFYNCKLLKYLPDISKWIQRIFIIYAAYFVIVLLY